MAESIKKTEARSSEPIAFISPHTQREQWFQDLSPQEREDYKEAVLLMGTYYKGVSESIADMQAIVRSLNSLLSRQILRSHDMMQACRRYILGHLTYHTDTSHEAAARVAGIIREFVPEILQEHAIQEAVLDIVSGNLKRIATGEIHDADPLLRDSNGLIYPFKIPERMLGRMELQNNAYRAMMALLETGEFQEAMSVRLLAFIPFEKLGAPLIKESSMKGITAFLDRQFRLSRDSQRPFVTSLWNGEDHEKSEVFQVVSLSHITPSEFKSCFIEAAAAAVRSGMVYQPKLQAERFDISWSEIIKEPRMQDAAREGIKTLIDSVIRENDLARRTGGPLEKIPWMIEAMHLPADLLVADSSFIEPVEKLIKAVSTGVFELGYGVTTAREFTSTLNLPPSIMDRIAWAALDIEVRKQRGITTFDMFDLGPDSIKTPEQRRLVLEAVKLKWAISLFGANSIINLFNLQPEELKKAALECTPNLVEKRLLTTLFHLIKNYNISDDELNDPAIRYIAIIHLPRLISDFILRAPTSHGNVWQIGGIEEDYCKHFRITESEKREALRSAIHSKLKFAHFGPADELYEARATHYKLEDGFLDSDEVKQSVRLGVLIGVNGGSPGDQMMHDVFRAQVEKGGELGGQIFHASSVIDEYYPPAIQKLGTVLGITTIKELLAFSEKEKTLWAMLTNGIYANSMGKDWAFTRKLHLEPGDPDLARKYHLTLSELEVILIRQGTREPLKDPDSRFDTLCRYGDWNDEQNIVGPFKIGREAFGTERMFAYIDRPGLSRHDALHAFGSINTLFTSSGLTPDQFYGNILFQVSKDGSRYDEGTAHHRLNSIAQSFPDIQKTIEVARRYKEINLLGELVEKYTSTQEIFSSWANLRRFHKLSQILDRAELLEKLKELKERGKDKLYHFVETLAFHPNSSVDMKAATMFWRNPEEFFSLQDDHTPIEVHNRKKPSNYTEIPNLDLGAEELRDAIVEGPLDSLQVFAPMTVEYVFKGEEEGEDLANLKESFKIAIGSQREGVKGMAKNPSKLFGRLRSILKEKGVSVADWLSGSSTLEENDDIVKNLQSLLYDPDIGISKKNGDSSKKEVYIAKINRKSDPDGVLAGNDTACCMPFGSGKNNVYMANPNTALFTIQIRRADGSLRTVAQSVLTKDIDIGRPIPEVIKEMNEQGSHIEQVIPGQILELHEPVLACDNIEISPNFRDPENSLTISQIYADFFSEYLKKQKERYNPEVVVGMGYTDLQVPLQRKPNTYAPKAPVGYSDKTGAEVLVMDTAMKGGKLNGRIVQEPETKEPTPPQRGVAELTFEDTLQVAYIEGKAYRDNESLMTYLHNMENGLIAKDINNAAKGRPNMSLKYIDGSGKMRGYIFAYEGRARTEGSEEKPVIYISDLATDKESRLAGGRLIKAFIEKYRTEYLAKGNKMPILAEARESTSYRIIMKQLESITQELGLRVELKEIDAEQKGRDVMHKVLVSVV